MAWEPWFNFSPDRLKVTCVFCHTSLSYKKDRAFALYGYGNYTSKTLCSNIPPVVRERFCNCGGVVPQQMTLKEMDLGESFKGDIVRCIESIHRTRGSCGWGPKPYSRGCGSLARRK